MDKQLIIGISAPVKSSTVPAVSTYIAKCGGIIEGINLSVVSEINEYKSKFVVNISRLLLSKEEFISGFKYFESRFGVRVKVSYPMSSDRIGMFINSKKALLDVYGDFNYTRLMEERATVYTICKEVMAAARTVGMSAVFLDANTPLYGIKGVIECDYFISGSDEMAESICLNGLDSTFFYWATFSQSNPINNFELIQNDCNHKLNILQIYTVCDHIKKLNLLSEGVINSNRGKSVEALAICQILDIIENIKKGSICVLDNGIVLDCGLVNTA